ncbi:hypothetical protein ZIOFF_006824 [Zingiber officinale]|uniref:Phosphatidic acid phosphatase type 2/haloperoxidase domain-containing protein n=1 Tax=Zingiber officinale TaxID=94328 RepID=A0A8J5LSJ4_ZINOF|nr:hypothetical protein ZIOFF_006824 [Zingiber officinale]
MEMGSSIPLWQPLTIAFVLGWVAAASSFRLSKRARALTQPCITRRVLAGTPTILCLQRAQHGFLDWMFSMISCIVSVPFYTGFLPIVYWSGHRKLARQMTLLIAFCDYIGNSIKDIVSAPRPISPPVRRVNATEEEKENSMEYGFPSSHCLNTVCLLGYFSHYFLTQDPKASDAIVAIVMALLSFFIVLIGIGRMYLGMHSLIDVVAGIIFGVLLLALWLTVHEHVDGFITTGHNGMVIIRMHSLNQKNAPYQPVQSEKFNILTLTTYTSEYHIYCICIVFLPFLVLVAVTYFWASLSFLLCFAYPTPEFPTPSFQYHTAFNGVAFGLVSGIQQTHLHSQPENIQILFSSELSIGVFLGRLLVGIPTILVTKICSKAVAQKLLPLVCNTLSIPITSSCYVPELKGRSKGKPSGHLARRVGFGRQEAYNVDTGIRFLQYAGLSWSAVVLVPAFFSLLRL